MTAKLSILALPLLASATGKDRSRTFKRVRVAEIMRLDREEGLGPAAIALGQHRISIVAFKVCAVLRRPEGK